MADTQDPGTVTTAATEPQGTAQATPGEGATTTTAAPADVEYAFETPEGVTLDEGDLNEFKTIAKELRLPQADAKKFVDIAVKRETARAEAYAKQIETWGNEVKADKELGAPENLAIAAKTIDTFGTPELKSLLNSTGMGNHPEVVRLALKIGRAIGEDKIIPNPGGGAGGAKDHAAVLYG